LTLYGAETWPLRKTEVQSTAAFERKVLGKMCGTHFNAQTNEWRKLRDSLIKIIIAGNHNIGKRPLGRPRLWWEDCVKRDAETMEPKIVIGREIAEDRDR